MAFFNKILLISSAVCQIHTWIDLLTEYQPTFIEYHQLLTPVLAVWKSVLMKTKRKIFRELTKQ